MLIGRSVDIASASNLITACGQRIEEFRLHIDTYAVTWYDTACKLGEQLNVEPTLPRRCGRQTARSNIPGDTVAEYLLRSITIPFLGKYSTCI